MYVYCIYRVISKSPKKRSNCLKRAETSVVLIVFDCVLCEVRAYKFISILNVLRFLTVAQHESGTKYKYIAKNIRSIPRDYSNRTEKKNINWAAKKYY